MTEPDATVEGYAAAIEPYAFSNAEGDVDHAVALRGGASESAPCESEDSDGVARSFEPGRKGWASSVEDGYEGREVLVLLSRSKTTNRM